MHTGLQIGGLTDKHRNTRTCSRHEHVFPNRHFYKTRKSVKTSKSDLWINSTHFLIKGDKNYIVIETQPLSFKRSF